MTGSALLHARQAMILAFIAYSSYSAADVLAKILSADHPIGLLLTAGGGGMVLISSLWLIARYDVRAALRSPRLHLHALRGAMVGVMAFLAVSAISMIPLPDFYGIIFFSPFLVVLAAKLMFGEAIGPHRLISIIAGFIGVLILTGPTFASANIGYAYVFVQMLIIPLHVMLMRRLQRHGQDPAPFYSLFPGLGILCSGLILYLPAPVPVNLWDIPIFFVYAAFISLGQLCFGLACMRTPLTAMIAPVIYVQMLWGVFYSLVFFGDAPSMTTLLGSAIIISAGVWMVMMEIRHHRRHAAAAQVIPPPD